ncbi:MAG: DUF4974 domain-containing protein [Candidatus Pseudobacter hemicellulosilyticus]|uniref:DUF4974 domain-containing protein n=1 Tax=Candidatus Pseudobacter hemicellulosilyticus TaxID=3121375 RepID=A0AAJ5WQE1_9BACT|nr:MAG: DUF4974 domain-containing protein [Pseudobacter sp.]
MEKKELFELIDRYLKGETSELENQWLKNYSNSFQETDAWDETREGSKQALLEEILSELRTSIVLPFSAPVPVRKMKPLRWAAAAAVLLLAGASTYVWLRSGHKDPDVASQSVQQIPDIAPGKEGAILVLADGTEVVLDSLGNGVIASQNGADALIRNGELVYNTTGAASGEVQYNTMRTPVGRQFTLILPDGTRVWLNAASSIRYPTAFTGTERKVEVSGEVYFETAKNSSIPLRINVVDLAELEVLGTNFNVNAYQNEESIETTLLEGSLRVSPIDRTAAAAVSPLPPLLLKAGQQAQLRNGSSKEPFKVINDPDIEKIMAWKNGLFNFEDATLEEVLRELERWYDIEVVYESEVPDIALMGKITRGVTLQGLLTALKKMGLQYRLEGRKLIVLS